MASKLLLKELITRAKAGDSLAMDHASRMARAKEGGWDNQMYRGQVGSQSTLTPHESTSYPSPSFSSRADFASSYAENPTAASGRFTSFGDTPSTEGANVAKYLSRGNVFDASKYQNAPYTETGMTIKDIENFADEFGLDSQDIISELDGKFVQGNRMEWDADAGEWDTNYDVQFDSYANMDAKERGGLQIPAYELFDLPNVQDAIKNNNYSGVSHKGAMSADITDYENPLKPPSPLNESMVDVETRIFDPSNIRSVNAAFDPSESSSSNLLASGLAGTAVAGGMLAPQEAEAGVVGKAAKKLADVSYRGEHGAPIKGQGAPLHDVTGGGEYYPDDIYSPQGLQYYGTGMDRMDRESMNIIQQARDKPDEMVTMYRAVPAGEKPPSKRLAELEKNMNAYKRRGNVPSSDENPNNLSGSDWYNDAWDRRAALEEMEDPAVEKIGMNAGDWVTLSRDYARDHGESALGGNYKIIKKKVPARQLYTQGDSINEFGYDPSVKRGMGAAAGAAALGGALYTPEQNKAEAGGLSKTFNYLHNLEKNPFKKSQGQFAMDVEPSGQYITPVDSLPDDTAGFLAGEKTFKNPLVIDFGGGYSDSSNWKRELSNNYGGKKGKALTNAIRKDGYDGILTMDGGDLSEAVDLYKGKGGVDMKSVGGVGGATGMAALYTPEQNKAEAGTGAATVGAYLYNNDTQPESTKPKELGLTDYIKGGADIAGMLGYGLASESVKTLSRLGGMVSGRGVEKSVSAAEALGGIFPQYEIGPDALAMVSKAYDAYLSSPRADNAYLDPKAWLEQYMRMGDHWGDVAYDVTGSPAIATGVKSGLEVFQ